MIHRWLRAPVALPKKPIFWVLVALTAVPLVLSFLPGWPAHGYGHVWFALPLWFWFTKPAQRKRLLLYGLGIGLQFLAYPNPDWGVLGWVLLWPYLLARECDDGASWWRAAFFYGFFRAVAGFYWLGNVHYTGWLAISLPSGLAFAFVFELLVRRLTLFPYALRVATAWFAFEGAHAWLIGGFPWLFLAHTQYRFPALIQTADLWGAFGVSFLVAFMQAAAFVALRTRRWTRELVAAALLLGAALLYGALRRGPEGPPGPGILMVQTNVPHSVKEELLVKDPQQIWDRHVRWTRQGMKEYPDARLIVWPETMAPFSYVVSEPHRGRFLSHARGLARAFDRPVIYGVNTYTSMRKLDRGFNSVVLVDSGGEVSGIYRKQRLVPMGEEFVPRWFLPEETGDRWFDWISSNLGLPRSCDLEAGEGFVTLDAGPGLRCAVLICFEGLYADLARGAVSEGDPDLLLLLVNNGWFGTSYEQRQFLAGSVFRAVETRTPVFICANTGITSVVAPDGEIEGQVDGAAAEGVLYARVPRRWPAPVFLRGGVYLLPALLGFGLLAAWIRSRLRGGAAER